MFSLNISAIRLFLTLFGSLFRLLLTVDVACIIYRLLQIFGFWGAFLEAFFLRFSRF
jgi:hypothetical protein